MNLTQVLKDQLDKEGAILDNANRDDKNIRAAIKVSKEVRKVLAENIRNIKAQIKAADRDANGKKASILRRSLAFFREQYNDLFEEIYMLKAQLGMVTKYLATQKELVVSLDTEWEKAKREAE